MQVSTGLRVGNIDFKGSETKSEQQSVKSESLTKPELSQEESDALKAQVLYQGQVKAKKTVSEKLRGSGTERDPYVVSADVSTTQNTDTTELVRIDFREKSNDIYYRNIITYDSDMPDIPAETEIQKGMGLWDEYGDILREMQHNNGELKLDWSDEDIIKFIAEQKGKSEDAIMAELAHTNKSPLEYLKNITNDALEESERLYQSFKPATKEGYLYRGLKIIDNPKFNDIYHCEDFANMMNNLQKGQTCIIDYAPMCAGKFNFASEYSGNAMLKIKVPVGAKLLHYKSEYRFPPKAQFLVNDVTELQSGFKIYDLEYIIPEE